MSKSDYKSMAVARLQREISFDLLARGRKERLSGVLLAHIPAGKTLAESDVKVDESMLEGFGVQNHSACIDQDKCRECQRRTRAEVVVIKTSDPSTSETQFFTPRVQQVVWSS